MEHEHQWTLDPAESSDLHKRYRCECGVWGWRTLPMRRGVPMPPIEAYRKGYTPTPQPTVRARNAHVGKRADGWPKWARENNDDGYW